MYMPTPCYHPKGGGSLLSFLLPTKVERLGPQLIQYTYILVFLAPTARLYMLSLRLDPTSRVVDRVLPTPWLLDTMPAPCDKIVWVKTIRNRKKKEHRLIRMIFQDRKRRLVPTWFLYAALPLQEKGAKWFVSQMPDSYLIRCPTKPVGCRS